MGLDIYAGSVTRYVAGDWLTIVQQTFGDRAVVVRANEAEDRVTDGDVIERAVAQWQEMFVRAFGEAARWRDTADVPYQTDKPNWDGYGAVLVLAACQEQPHLTPGTTTEVAGRSITNPPLLAANFQDGQVFKIAATAPNLFPVLLKGAEWCLPVPADTPLFDAPTPNGTEVLMGSLAAFVDELRALNERTLRLSPADLKAVRAAGPPDPNGLWEDAAPFGLSILLELAEFALANSVAWIMDY